MYRLTNINGGTIIELKQLIFGYVFGGMIMESVNKFGYDLERYLLPVWKGDTVYNESVMPIKNADGTISPISLVYDIDEIVGVLSSDLLTLYEEGRDYTVEDGKLCINPQGNIPAMEYEDYYPDKKKDNVKPRTGGGNILFIEGGYFHTKQIAVTYTHKDCWQGRVPEAQGRLLPRALSALKEKRPLKMAFFGDSIFTGCNSSGTPMGGSQAPFMPAWFDMLTEKMKKIYGYEDITYINPSRGGTKSFWGVEVGEERVAVHTPDLVWLGFGMNDRETTPEVYIENIKEIMRIIKEKNPDCEFVLTAPMLASKDAEGFFRSQIYFVDEMNKLKGEGLAVMDVTGVHDYFLTRKSYRDTTGNNLNHPNDFLCRVYAQTALECIKE